MYACVHAGKWTFCMTVWDQSIIDNIFTNVQMYKLYIEVNTTMAFIVAHRVDNGHFCRPLIWIWY